MHWAALVPLKLLQCENVRTITKLSSIIISFSIDKKKAYTKFFIFIQFLLSTIRLRSNCYVTTHRTHQQKRDFIVEGNRICDQRRHRLGVPSFIFGFCFETGVTRRQSTVCSLQSTVYSLIRHERSRECRMVVLWS